MFRAIVVGAAATILMAMWIQFHEVLVPQHAMLAENSPPAAAVGLFLGIIVIVAALNALRSSLRLTRTELVVIYSILVTAAPFMTQGMWHRFLGLLTAIPHNTNNYELVDSFSEKLWPHGRHLIANRRFAKPPAEDMRVVPEGAASLIAAEETPIGATSALELSNPAGSELADREDGTALRIRIPRERDGVEQIVPGERYYMHALFRMRDMDAAASVDVLLEWGEDGEQSILTLRRDTPETYSSVGGFRRSGLPYVVIPREIDDYVDLVFRLRGAGRVAVTDITFFSNEALARLYRGSLEVRESDYPALARNERDATIVRPDSLASPAGIWYVLKGYVPWSQWIGPLSYWLVIILALFFCLLGIGVLFRRQWEDNERFPFPLVVLPRLLIEQKDENGRLARPLFRKRTFRIGAIVALFICLLQGLAFYVPGVPDPTVRVDLAEFVASPAAKAFMKGFYTSNFEVMILFLSIAFFIDLEMLLSIQVFFWLSKVPYFLGENFGWKSIRGLVGQKFPFSQEQHIGSFLALALMVLWVSRKHLALVWRRVLGDRAAVDDSREVVSYRAAVAMIAAAFAVFAAWGRITGLGVGSALVFFGFLVICGLAAARIRTECGAPAAYFTPYYPYLIFFLFGGLAVFGTQTLVLAFVAGGFMAVAQFLMFAPTQVEMMHLGNQFGVKPRRIGWSLTLGVLGGVIIGGYVMLVWCYGVGAENIPHMKSWGVNQNWYLYDLRTAVSEADNTMKAGRAIEANYVAAPLVATGIGFGMTLLLTFLRARFVGFWLHPIAYVFSNTYFIYMTWGSLLVALIVKWIAVKVGGARLIRETMTPLFAGLFCGAVAGIVFWDIVAVVAMNQGVQNVFVLFP